jgi:basic amino acid/polyamine antiporter, APA family
VRDARRTVPRATVIGAATAGLVYLLACSAVLLLLPADRAATSPAPFADAVAIVAGDGAGLFIAGFAVLSAAGALNGWVLCSGEVPLGLARNGLFPRWFGKTVGAADTPIRAQVVASACASILVVSNYSGSMAQLFAFMTLISTVSTLVLYLLCAASAVVLMRKGALAAPLLLPAAAIGIAFNLWAFWGAGAEATAWGFGLLMTGLPAYALIRWENQPTRATAGR